MIVGAGPGFGRTLALRAAAQGATVVVAARTAARVEEIAEEVRAAGGNAHAAAVDATDPESVRELRETVSRHTDAVHGLVYSAFAVGTVFADSLNVLLVQDNAGGSASASATASASASASSMASPSASATSSAPMEELPDSGGVGTWVAMAAALAL